MIEIPRSVWFSDDPIAACLMHADWLEERGDLRAEKIRRVCEPDFFTGIQLKTGPYLRMMISFCVENPRPVFVRDKTTGSSLISYRITKKDCVFLRVNYDIHTQVWGTSGRRQHIIYWVMRSQLHGSGARLSMSVRMMYEPWLKGKEGSKVKLT